MGYIENNLSADEKIIARIKHSWAGLVSTAIRFFILLALGIFCFFLDKIVCKIVGAEVSSLDSFGIFYKILMYFGGAFALLAALLVLLAAISEINSAQLVVTNKRIFGRRGFISKSTTDMLLSKIDTISVSNGFFGAIFHYGTIEIVSAASVGLTRAERASRKYLFISNTSEFRNAVLETIDKVKKEESEAQARSLRDAMNRG